MTNKPAYTDVPNTFCSLHTDEEGNSYCDLTCQECVRYRDLFQNAPLGIFQCDSERHFLNVNPQLAALYGFDSPEELMDSLDDVAERLILTKEEVDDALETLRLEGVIRNFEVQLQRTDGSLLWTAHSIRAVTTPQGDIRFYDGFVTDISEKKELERLREDVTRMTRHDIKSPLLSIVAASQLLAKHLDLEGEEAEMLQDIRDKSSMVLEMINTSLDLFKMEQGDYKPRFVPFDMAILARRVGRSLLAAYQEKNLDYHVLVDSEEEEDNTTCEFLGEERHIETMLMNLVKNAMEAAPPSTSITVSMSRSEDTCNLSVHNYGTIPEDIRPRFFQRYSTSGKPEGLGLGAYSSKLITEAHGGSISFSTSEDEGTRINVTIPCRNDTL